VTRLGGGAAGLNQLKANSIAAVKTTASSVLGW